MALSDSEVEKQINHMKSFIEQEAQEKAEEIHIKAEEEFNIEKGRLLQNEKRKVMNYYERKEKNLELQRKIQHSNLLNQARLSVLKAREDHIQGVLDEARDKLEEVTKDATRWGKMLENLITQGLYQLLEAEVTVKCRRIDLKLVQNALAPAMKRFAEATGKNCKVIINQDEFLSDESSGGVEIYALSGKIKLSNTLESRLQLLGRQMLPEIRTQLFGANPSRHFMD